MDPEVPPNLEEEPAQRSEDWTIRLGDKHSSRVQDE